MSTSIGTNVNTMKWLIKREFWEHKGGFFWAPIVVGAILVCLFILPAMIGLFSGGGVFQVNGISITALVSDMAVADKERLGQTIADRYLGASAPLFAVLAFVGFFYSLNTLFDERKDRSILFWKSLPISDSKTVLAKVFFVLGIAPVIAVICAVILSLTVLFLAGILAMSKGINLLGYVLSNPSFYAGPVYLFAMIPIYLLWALPTVGWLLLVGAWAKGKPIVWAVGAPILAVGLIAWVNKIFELGWDTNWLWSNIIVRGLFSILPGSWLSSSSDGLNPHAQNIGSNSSEIMFTQALQQLGTANLWIGVFVGAAFIYAAIRVRRWKDEG